MLAPSAQASRGVLRSDGFADADTVAHFLADAKAQSAARGKLVVVDEAVTAWTRANAAAAPMRVAGFEFDA